MVYSLPMQLTINYQKTDWTDYLIVNLTQFEIKVNYPEIYKVF